MADIYCKPILELGTGLGNRLFPWARCVLYARTHGAAMIDPVWMRPAIGQLFRGGIDYRSYLGQLLLFRLFRHGDRNLGVLAGLVRSRGASIVEEAPSTAAATFNGSDKVLLLFRGTGDYFEALTGRHDLLLRELRAITRSRYLEMADGIGDVPIGICVRCGNDYAEPNNLRYAPLASNEKTPLEWYATALTLIRREAGRAAPAFVVSDGTREALRPLLEMERVTFVRPGAAISDLLILAKAKVLLAPGASSFAAWAAFFGQMPSATHPGQPLSAWRLRSERGQFMGELDPSRPDPQFLRQAAEAVA